ncbi:hypothetical protein MAP00_005463 [Monascus purpureus]|nr:hypothetical protein MAP00_005463 [Monascus purpureus]
MASAVQLIFFEFFTGHDSEGKIHLRAATNISQQGFRDKLVYFDPNARAKSILCGDRLLSEEDGPAVMEEVTLFNSSPAQSSGLISYPLSRREQHRIYWITISRKRALRTSMHGLLVTCPISNCHKL